MPPSKKTSAAVFPRAVGRLLVERRGEVVLAFAIGAVALLTFVWVALTPAAEEEPSLVRTARRAPRTETSLRLATERERRRGALEKIFERPYPDAFLPRQAPAPSPPAAQQPGL